ncbi:MAG: flavodoxin family protein [Lachnotalea sp.]
MSEFAVVYSSFTGNTEKIASAIYQSISSSSKDICKIGSDITKDFADNYFIGFNIENGTAPDFVSNFIQQLHYKNIALFGTFGNPINASYYNFLTNNISNLLPPDNQYLGCFLCQGKMPISVRNEYTKMLSNDSNNIILHKSIENYDVTMLHPNAEDEKNASDFTKNVTSKILMLSR